MWLNFFVLVAVLTLGTFAQSDPLTPKKLYKTKHSEEGNDIAVAPYTDPFDGIDYRLPNTTRPISYNIWLSTDIHRGDFTFNGVVTIQIEALENTPEITLHYRELTITNVRLLRDTGGTIQSNVPTTSRDDVEFLIIRPTVPLTQGTIYGIAITYTGVLRNDDAGFYRSSYQNTAGNTVWLATTQFESTDARHAFPCFDEPGIRSRYTIQIQHDESYNAISNAPEISRVPVAGTTNVLTTFADVESVQSYLIAFVVSDFSFVQDSTGRVPHRIYAKPQSIVEGHAKLAIDSSIKILEGFEDYLNTAYSLAKMDQAAIPDFAAGAMENWGLVTYREQYLLFNEQTGTTRDRENIITIIAHEFAHQWFGNLISPAWWTYIWLNEGFATLYENYLLDVVYPDERWVDTFMVETFQPVMETDASPNIRPMSFYVESPQRISSLFDSIAYSKSGSVLSMFLNAFGDATWKKGLSYYLAERGFNSGTPGDLHFGVQTAVFEDGRAGVPNVALAMESWESQSGFPYITVTRNGDQLTFDQDRFMYTNRDSTNLWYVPINYVVGSNSDFSSTLPDFWLLGEKSTTIESSTAPKPFTADDWIVVNIKQSGYYRVNYDSALWNLLIQQLNGDNFEQIHILNRAQLVDDSFHLARADLLNFRIPFEVMNYMEKETDYIPWASANRANTLLNRWTFGSRVHLRYQVFMRKNVASVFNKLGTNIIEDEPRVDRYARIIAINIACQAQMSDCLTATALSLQNMFTTGTPLAPDLVSSVYCNGMRTASYATFINMLDKLYDSPSQAERNTIISSIGCTQNTDILSEYFGLAVHPLTSLSNAERSRILTSAINIGVDSIRTMINFLQAESTGINSFNLVATMASNIAARIHDQALLNEFEPLLDSLQASGLLTANQVTNYKATARGILDWQNAYLDHIEGFFVDQGVTDPPTTIPPITTAAPTDAPTTVDVTTTAPSTPAPTDTTLGAGNIVLSTAVLLSAFIVRHLL